MEVHHHSHPSPGSGHRKKWTHYFWEFLMLFLAVFCGFLAEYQLEHKIEKNRERQFMISLIEDLAADTNAIAFLNIQRIDRLQMYDSLSKAIFHRTYVHDGANFYYWGRNISRRVIFFSSDGTMQQLKNAGGLRLISKRTIVDKITEYDVLYRSIAYQQEFEEDHLDNYRLLAAKVFDAEIINTMTSELTNRKVDFNNKRKDKMIPLRNNFFRIPEGNPQLKTNAESELNELANRLNYWAAGSFRVLELMDQLYVKAEELITLIKKEYHLK